MQLVLRPANQPKHSVRLLSERLRLLLASSEGTPRENARAFAVGRGLRAVALLVRGRLLVVEVVGDSMLPSYPSGSRVICEVVGDETSLCRGDVVVFAGRLDEQELEIKRIAAVPGDNWDIGRQPVPPDNFIVLGDNPEKSGDSRRFGPIHRKQLRARVVA
jgi:signal peptidase I